MVWVGLFCGSLFLLPFLFGFLFFFIKRWVRSRSFESILYNLNRCAGDEKQTEGLAQIMLNPKLKTIFYAFLDA